MACVIAVSCGRAWLLGKVARALFVLGGAKGLRVNLCGGRLGYCGARRSVFSAIPWLVRSCVLILGWFCCEQ